jgi:hypothetical protein
VRDGSIHFTPPARLACCRFKRHRHLTGSLLRTTHPPFAPSPAHSPAPSPGPTADWYTKLYFPRIDLGASLTALVGVAPPPAPVDTTPPTGSLSINGGAADTYSLEVSLRVNGSDAGSGVSTMCVSNTAAAAADCLPWVPFSTSPFNWTLSGLPADAGTRTVNLFLADAANNTSPLIQSSIEFKLDTQPPEVVSVKFNGGAAATVTFDVTVQVAAADATGVATMCLTNEPTDTVDSCTPYVPYSPAPFNWWVLVCLARGCGPSADGRHPHPSKQPALPYSSTTSLTFHHRTLGEERAGEGNRTVYLFLVDTLGYKTSTASSFTIFFDVDTEPPGGLVC